MAEQISLIRHRRLQILLLGAPLVLDKVTTVPFPLDRQLFYLKKKLLRNAQVHLQYVACALATKLIRVCYKIY